MERRSLISWTVGWVQEMNDHHTDDKGNDHFYNEDDKSEEEGDEVSTDTSSRAHDSPYPTGAPPPFVCH